MRETGINLPDLDVLIILSDFYQVDIRQLLDGQRKREKQEVPDMPQKLEAYQALRHRDLLNLVVLVVAAGVVALGLSFLLVFLLAWGEKDYGGVLLWSFFGFLAYGGILYAVTGKNQTTLGHVLILLNGFLAVIVSNVWLLLSFRSPDYYQNVGMTAGYYAFGVTFLSYLAAGILSRLLLARRNRTR